LRMDQFLGPPPAAMTVIDVSDIRGLIL